MPQHPVVSQEERLTARKALLILDKRLTHLRDKIRAERLALPCFKVEPSNQIESAPRVKLAVASHWAKGSLESFILSSVS